MGRIHQLPYISGLAAALITGIASYAAKVEMSTVYLRMSVMMLVFYLIGLFIRKTVSEIEKEVQDKKDEQLRIEEENVLKQIEEEKASAAAAKQKAQGGAPARQDKSREKVQDMKDHKVDLTAGSDDDGFQPLVLSQAVSTKIKE